MLLCIIYKNQIRVALVTHLTCIPVENALKCKLWKFDTLNEFYEAFPKIKFMTRTDYAYLMEKAGFFNKLPEINCK